MPHSRVTVAIIGSMFCDFSGNFFGFFASTLIVQSCTAETSSKITVYMQITVSCIQLLLYSIVFTVTDALIDYFKLQ